DRDHVAEPAAVSLEQLIAGGTVSGGDSLQQVLGVSRGHRGPLRLTAQHGAECCRKMGGSCEMVVTRAGVHPARRARKVLSWSGRNCCFLPLGWGPFCRIT